MSRDWHLLVEDILEAARRAVAFVDGVEYQAFLPNLEKIAAVERQIFIVGEAAAQLPESVRRLAPAVPWRGIIGMRNVLAHGYWKSDEETLWDTARNELPLLILELERLRLGTGNDVEGTKQ